MSDSVITGAVPHYGGYNLAFARTVMALAATLPLAIDFLEPPVKGMSATK